jgi:hypothetical protein
MSFLFYHKKTGLWRLRRLKKKKGAQRVERWISASRTANVDVIREMILEHR